MHRAAPLRPRPLWRYLWVLTLIALGMSWLTLVFVAYFTGLHEADEVTDGQLASSVQMLLRQPAMAAPAAAPMVLTKRDGTAEDLASYAPELHVVVWQDERVLWDTHGLASALPARLTEQPQDVSLVWKGQSQVWRALLGTASTGSGGTRKVLVLIDKDRREALGRDIAWHIVRPALVLLPLVALLLLWAIRRGLLPLQRLAEKVADLDLDAGQLLPTLQPYEELSGTVNAINRLAQRLQAQVLRERSFASDVAHELRTPLTAQVLQARLARVAVESNERDLALQQVEQNALRAGRILAQLMDLARAQGLDHQALQRLDLNALCHQLVAEHVPLAHQLGQELALEVPNQALWVYAHNTMLELALGNLIDNALRHNPAGTQVEVSVVQQVQGQVSVRVSDDGVAWSSRTVVQPGMGIGLTLVRRIADWHGLVFDQRDGTAPFTKCYALTWRAAPAQSSDAVSAASPA